VLAGTSLENNNVFTVQPTVYFEGMDPATESASMYQDVDLIASGPLNPATVTVGIVALGIVAVAGSATAIYYEVRPSICWGADVDIELSLCFIGGVDEDHVQATAQCLVLCWFCHTVDSMLEGSCAMGAVS
jgi:hypothetical protein